MKFQIKDIEKIVYREEDEDALLFEAETGNVWVLNNTGRKIWNLLSGQAMTDAQILENLFKIYPSEPREKVEIDALKYLEKMQKLNLIISQD